MKKLIKRILAQGCAIYTVVITALYIIGYIVGDGKWIPSFRIMWIVLGMSFVIAAAERLFDKRGANVFTVAVHFAVCVTGFLLIFMLGGQYYNDPSSILIGTVAFMALYIVFTALRFALNGKLKRVDAEEEYTPAFDSKTKD